MAAIKISSKVDEKAWAEFRELARESHQNISGLLSEAIREYVVRRRIRERTAERRRSERGNDSESRDRRDDCAAWDDAIGHDLGLLPLAVRSTGPRRTGAEAGPRNRPRRPR